MSRPLSTFHGPFRAEAGVDAGYSPSPETLRAPDVSVGNVPERCRDLKTLQLWLPRAATSQTTAQVFTG